MSGEGIVNWIVVSPELREQIEHAATTVRDASPAMGDVYWASVLRHDCLRGRVPSKALQLRMLRSGMSPREVLQLVSAVRKLGHEHNA